MSLYGMMRTGVSGMAAQANKLATVADNIANSSTTGYKRSRADFSTLIVPQTTENYTSSGVTTTVRYAIAQQGALQYTTSITDLAVSGDGFFIVQDANGSNFLTRAGAFVPDAQGRLVNAAGFQLLGYSYANGDPTIVANGFGGLEPVTVAQGSLTAAPSTKGMISANLPAGAEAIGAADLPSANSANAAFHAKTSMVAYDSLGSEVTLDVYFAKTGDNSWEVTVYNKADAAAGGGFPYASGPMSTQTLSFDPTTGGFAAGSAQSLAFNIPGGAAVTLDLAEVTQLAAEYTLFDVDMDGNAPSAIEQVSISKDGTVYAQYESGSMRALYRIPLATTRSPDMMQVVSGNVYSASLESGEIRVGFANDGTMGAVVSGALEGSNVDIADELTGMIEAQRSYTANSKVFQTGADLMDILVNLKR